MGEEQYVKLLSHWKLEKSRVVLQSYSGAYLDVVEVAADDQYAEKKYELPFIIVEERKPAL